MFVVTTAALLFFAASQQAPADPTPPPAARPRPPPPAMTCLLVEPRFTARLVPTLRNIGDACGGASTTFFFTSRETAAVLPAMERLRVVVLDSPPATPYAYSALLMRDAPVWTTLAATGATHVLVTQTDGWLCPKAMVPGALPGDFARFDFVGGPDAVNHWNGGVSLRRIR